MKRVRLIAAWFLLLALPLQGIAAHAPVMPCDSAKNAAAHQAHEFHDGHGAASVEQDHHSHATGEQHQQGNSEPSGSAAGHSCCHHVSTGVLPTEHAGMPESPQEVASSVQLLTTLFIPELPQRPPRA